MKKNWKFKTGLSLIILSTLLFLSLLVIPFLNMEGAVKIKLSTVAFVLGEITFWAGGILLGKELFSKYKSYFNPMNWFRKKAGALEVEDSGISLKQEVNESMINKNGR
jgi:hypothetical protein